MELYRSVIEELKAWKSRKDRKPLVMQGARQTGKTWMLKYFGNTEYVHLAYFNFDDDDTLKDVFQRTKDPKRITKDGFRGILIKYPFFRLFTYTCVPIRWFRGINTIV